MCFLIPVELLFLFRCLHLHFYAFVDWEMEGKSEEEGIYKSGDKKASNKEEKSLGVRVLFFCAARIVVVVVCFFVWLRMVTCLLALAYGFRLWSGLVCFLWRSVERRDDWMTR